MANPIKKQLKAAKKQEKQFNKQQEAQNIQARINAQKHGTAVPLGAQQKPGFFKSTDPQAISINTLTPQQQQLINQLSPLVQGGLQNLNLPGQQSNFQPIADEARRNFSQNTIPTLAERFAGLGRGSSGLEQTLGGAAAQFESQLAAMQAQHGLNENTLQSSNLFNLLGAGLSPQQDIYGQPGQASTARNAFNTLLPIAGQAGLNYLIGGGANAGLGALKGLGSSLGSQQQQQSQTNGSGVGSNSFGFQSQQRPAWQPQQANMSTQQLASSGYPQLNDVFNQGQYKF